MVDDAGQPISDDDVLGRVGEVGAVVVRRGPVESLDLDSWRRQLRAQAKARGFRIHVRKTDDGMIIVSDPDHVVDRQRLRAAVQRMSLPSESGDL